MIFDSLENLSLYAPVIPQLQAAIVLINDPNFDLTPGAHTTAIEGLRYNVAQYETLEGDKEFEIHKKEIDVQIMILGQEYIASAPRVLAEMAGPYDEKGDAMMVQGDYSEKLKLDERKVAIYFPGEPHKPGLAVNKSQKIKKVIFKIVF